MEKNKPSIKLNVFSTPDEVLQHLADYFVYLANQNIEVRGRFAVALSGGSSPKKLYELLASDAYKGKVDWDKVDFFFGDERYVPHTSPESNYRMAKLALLDPLEIPSTHVFAVDTEPEPAPAALAYATNIQSYFNGLPARFDLVLLGLGDNAHTASLFPHTPVLHEQASTVKEAFLPEQQVYRITLTAPLINQAQAVAFLVYGQDKAQAVQQILEADRDIEQYPAQLIAPKEGDLQWFLDSAAASELSEVMS